MIRTLTTRAIYGLLLTLVVFSGALAQEDIEYKMPCEQVLKLGLDKFMDAYGEKTQDYSTYGQKQAFGYFVNCKRPVNDALAARTLSEAQRKQIDDVREAFNKFGSDLWGLKYLEEGGGTMWGLASVGSYAEREIFMETLIKTFAVSSKKSRGARLRANTSLLRIQRLLSSRDRQPFVEGAEPEDITQRKQSYQENMKEVRDGLTKLRSILAALPDPVADRLATQMASETKNALADSI